MTTNRKHLPTPLPDGPCWLGRIAFCIVAMFCLTASNCPSKRTDPQVESEIAAEVEEFAAPLVALDGNGNAMILAHHILRRGPLTSPVGVAVQRYEFSQATVVEGITLSGGTDLEVFSRPGSTALAMDGSGQATAVWRCESCSSIAYVARYVPGSGWTSAQPFSDDVNEARRFAAAMNGGGQALIVNGSEGRPVTATRVLPAGSLEQQQFGTLISPAGGDDRTILDVAYWVGGVGYAAWLESDGVFASRFLDASGWETASRVTEQRGGAPVRLALRRTAVNAGAMLAWHGRAPTDAGIVTSRFLVGSGWQAPQEVTGNEEAGGFDLAMAANGDVMAVWSWRSDLAAFGVAVGAFGAARFSAGSWSPTEVPAGALVIGSSNDVNRIRVAMDGVGNAVAIGLVRDGPGSDEGRIVSSRYVLGDGWSAPREIGRTIIRGGSAPVFDLDMDDTGRAMAVWETRVPASGGTRVATHIFGQPEARFSFTPATPAVGETVTFDATASTDEDGNILAHEWDFDGGDFDATGVTAQFIYSTAGIRTARLRVTDNLGIAAESLENVNVSPAPGGTEFGLEVFVTGLGSGRVTACTAVGPSTCTPVNIDCGGGMACTARFPAGTSVRLTPTPDAGSEFSWGSDSDADCADGVVEMSADRFCEVRFDFADTGDATFTIRVNISNQGGSNDDRVSSSPPGLVCRAGPDPFENEGVCEAQFSAPQVQLTAQPADGDVFDQWGGTCAQQPAVCVIDNPNNGGTLTIGAAFRPGQ